MTTETPKRVRRYWKHPTGVCSVEGCGRPVRARDLCHMHYLRLRRTGEVGGVEPIPQPAGSSSSIGRDPRLSILMRRVVRYGAEVFSVFVGRGQVRVGTRLAGARFGGPSLWALERRGWLLRLEVVNEATIRWQVTEEGQAAARRARRAAR
jgi:hypothetical protein